MSFSVEYRIIYLKDRNNADDKYGVYYDQLKNYCGTISITDFDDTNVSYELDTSLEYISTSSGGDKIEYKVVESSGPIVDFLGWNMDLESGYVLIGDKSNVYVPLFNLYDFLEDIGFNIDKELFKEVVEKFKLGDFDINKEFAFGEMLYKSQGLSRSVISSFLEDNVERESIRGEDEYVRLFFYLENLMLNELVAKLNIGLMYEYIEGFREVVESFRNDILYMNMKEGSDRALSQKIIRTLFNDKMDDYDMEMEDLRKYQINIIQDIFERVDWKEEFGKSSTDVMYDIYKNRYDIYKEDKSEASKLIEIMNDRLGDISKTELDVINIYDLVDSYQENHKAVEMEAQLNTASYLTDNNQLRKVVDKIGIKEYVSGASLAHLSKRIKGVHDKERVVDIIDKARSISNEYDMFDIGNKYGGDEIDKMVNGMRKRNKYYRNILKDIDKKLR